MMPVAALRSSPKVAPAANAALSSSAALNQQVEGGGLLRQGARGEAVRQAQDLLIAQGQSLSADGVFGPRTHDAVVAFQRSRGLGADGVIGPQTLRELRTSTAGLDQRLDQRSGAEAGLTPSPQDRVPGMTGADFQRRAALEAARREAAPPASASTLPSPGTYPTAGGPVRVQAPAAEPARSAEAARVVEEMRAQGFFPVRLGDGSSVFMTNPSYAADQNGGGTSSREAHDYAREHGLRLPTQGEADAFRAQAQVRVQFEPGPTPGTAGARSAADQQARIDARLRAVGVPDGVSVAGATKVWAQNPGQRPGLNGALRNVESGAAWQGYSTVHGPDYEDYSQAAQFVHPGVRLSAAGDVLR
jgi:peptidoglycan hydrolase-like protein with peptidoglycan-binding domain